MEYDLCEIPRSQFNKYDYAKYVIDAGGPAKALSETVEFLGNLKLSRLIFVAISFRFFVKRVNH